MSHSRVKRLPKILIGQFLVSALIIVLAGYLVLYSLGYKINLTSRKIIKTGLIVLSVHPMPDSVQVGSKIVTGKDDVSFPLEPGFYDITVKKAGYQDWTMRSEVNAELVNYFKYVELFKIPDPLQQLTDKNAIEALDTPSSVLAVNSPKGLNSNDYEIWVSDRLVTRFSSAISQSSWFGDDHHILFQQGSFIHVIDEDGSNDKIIANLPSASPAKFLISNKNQTIHILQDGKYYSRDIQ